jgi:hypothetical protein
MRFFLLVIVLSLGAGICSCFGQVLSTLKLSAGAGCAIPTVGLGSKAGGLVFAESAIPISERAFVGLRFEAARFTRGISDLPFTEVRKEASSVLSASLFGYRYFGDGIRIRPFLGFGVSVLKTSSVTLVGSYNKIQTAGYGTTFGFFPRVGFDFHRFRISADYNYVTPTEVNETGFVHNSYCSLRLGYIFGQENVTN